MVSWNSAVGTLIDLLSVSTIEIGPYYLETYSFHKLKVRKYQTEMLVSSIFPKKQRKYFPIFCPFCQFVFFNNSLEARAEIRTKFMGFFWENEDVQISFWDFLAWSKLFKKFSWVYSDATSYSIWFNYGVLPSHHTWDKVSKEGHCKMWMGDRLETYSLFTM